VKVGVDDDRERLRVKDMPRPEGAPKVPADAGIYRHEQRTGGRIAMAHPSGLVSMRAWLSPLVMTLSSMVRSDRLAPPTARGRAGRYVPGVEMFCWSLGVAAALGLGLTIFSRGPDQEGPSAVPPPNGNHVLETGASSPPADLPKVGEETRPPLGAKLPFTQANVRYCLFQQVRLEAVRPLTDSADLALFNTLVNDWNARCGRPRYLASDKSAVDRELLDRRTVLEVEGRSLLMGWRKTVLKASDRPALGAIIGPRASSPTWEVVNGASAGIDRPSGAPALPPAITGQPAPAADADGWGAKEPSLMLLHAYVAARVQKRLNELGYTNTAPDGAWGPMSRNALRAFKQANGLLWDDALDRETVARLFSMAAVSATPGAGSPGDDGVQPFETTYPPPPAARMNPLNRSDCEWIERRLTELGYYVGDVDGLWGIAARSALREFKSVNHLPNDDEWDVATELALKSDGAMRALDTFAARWPARSLFCSAAPVGAEEAGAKAGVENVKSFAELTNLCRTASSEVTPAPRLSFRPMGAATSAKRTGPSPHETQKPPVPLPAPSWLRLSAAANR
jgi:hypothetical protein